MDGPLYGKKGLILKELKEPQNLFSVLVLDPGTRNAVQ